ncbi:MAG TPA: hypothetical protein VMK84_14015 [Streptosporangiaceae bacterium]|nr:hypothetical protein [Streptosporangiaceae bacterium]
MPRTMRLEGLGELLEKQSSVVSRGQLLTLGMSDRAMQYRVRRSGPWRKLLPGVYLAATGIPSLYQKELAAVLYAGPGSLVTGPMALMHHSIRSGSPIDVIDVLVPTDRQRLSTGFARLHRTVRLPARASSIGLVRLALAPRAVADTARQLTELRDIRAVVADAVQLGRCTIGQLAEELRIGPVKGSALFRSVLAEVADGVRSTAEGDLRDVIRTARLPMPLFNPSLYNGDVFLGKPDAWWPDAGVAGEVDSREWHLSPEDWDRTRRRHDRMAAAGIIVLHFSPAQIRREPAEVAQMIKGALDRGIRRPGLLIHTVPCGTSGQ